MDSSSNCMQSICLPKSQSRPLLGVDNLLCLSILLPIWYASHLLNPIAFDLNSQILLSCHSSLIWKIRIRLHLKKYWALLKIFNRTSNELFQFVCIEMIGCLCLIHLNVIHGIGNIYFVRIVWFTLNVETTVFVAQIKIGYKNSCFQHTLKRSFCLYTFLCIILYFVLHKNNESGELGKRVFAFQGKQHLGFFLSFCAF